MGMTREMIMLRLAMGFENKPCDTCRWGRGVGWCVEPLFLETHRVTCEPLRPWDEQGKLIFAWEPRAENPDDGAVAGENP